MSNPDRWPSLRDVPRPGAAGELAPSTFGRGLWAGGALTLAVLAGVVAGYWIGDRGVRWVPDLLGIVAVLGVLALIAMAVGASAFDAGGARLRKRSVALLGLALLAAGVRLAVHVASKPSPLSTLSASMLRNVTRLSPALVSADISMPRGFVMSAQRSVTRASASSNGATPLANAANPKRADRTASSEDGFPSTTALTNSVASPSS